MTPNVFSLTLSLDQRVLQGLGNYRKKPLGNLVECLEEQVVIVFQEQVQGIMGPDKSNNKSETCDE